MQANESEPLSVAIKRALETAKQACPSTINRQIQSVTRLPDGTPVTDWDASSQTVGKSDYKVSLAPPPGSPHMSGDVLHVVLERVRGPQGEGAAAGHEAGGLEQAKGQAGNSANLDALEGQGGEIGASTSPNDHLQQLCEIKASLDDLERQQAATDASIDGMKQGRAEAGVSLADIEQQRASQAQQAASIKARLNALQQQQATSGASGGVIEQGQAEGGDSRTDLERQQEQQAVITEPIVREVAAQIALLAVGEVQLSEIASDLSSLHFMAAMLAATSTVPPSAIKEAGDQFFRSWPATRDPPPSPLSDLEGAVAAAAKLINPAVEARCSLACLLVANYHEIKRLYPNEFR